MSLSKEDDIEEMAKKWASVISDKYVRGQAEEAARILLRHGVEKLPELREADLGKIRKMQGMYAKFEQPMAEGFESKIYVNRQAYKQWKAGQEYAKKLGYAAQDNNILHELGHYVDYLNDPKTMRERFYQKIEGINKDLVEKNLSKYALTNKCEFEAELNAAIMSGKVMPKEILDYSGMNSTKTPLAKRLLAYGAGKDVCLPNEDLRKKYKDAMKAMYHQEGSTFSIDILGNKDVQEFISAHATMLDNSFKQVEMTPKMRERLTRSDYIFSGMKAFHEMNEAFPSMVDENGDRKPFERFLNDVRKLDEKYNANYLHAEYNFVAASATMAAKWERFSDDGDRYYLQYRTAHDDKVRPEHAALDGVTLPMSDTFWETYYPPNGWNCFTPGTPVLTASGWKNIVSVKKGDLVVGGSGELREVTATLARPFKGDLVTIVSKGAKATCTPNHRFCTRRGWVKAEDLHKGDIIIQVGEHSMLHLLVHAVSNAYALLRYGLMACVRKGKAVASLAVYNKAKAGNEEIDHVATHKLALLEWEAHVNEVSSHDFFAFAHWRAQCAHPLWMKLASGKRPIGRLLSYIWSKKRRGALQLFRYIANEAAVRLGLALAHMKTLGGKLVVSLRKSLASFRSPSYVFVPLGSDGIAAMPDRDLQLVEDAMHGPAVDSPVMGEPSEASLLSGVPEFCGIEDIHAFNGFHSFFDFLRKTFLHTRYVLVEGKVIKKKRETMVFNLSISEDESYIVPVGIAHNCRCTVVQVRKQKYPATDHEEAMERGEEALSGDKLGMFRFNPGKQGKAMPDYNPYTIKRCNDCDVAKGKLPLAFVPENDLCASCIKTHECWARKQEDTPEAFYECSTKRGKVRVSSKHGKTEKKENVRVATYLAEKHGYEIDLIANPSDRKTADSLNKTLGIEQEYKVNTLPTKSSIDNLVRKGAKQANDLVLFIDSEMPLNELSSALHDRVRRTNLNSVMVFIDGKDKTYTYSEITANGFKIRQADLK